MKKKVVIGVLVVVAMLVGILLYFYIDYTRIIEKRLEYSTLEKMAYSLEEKENEIVHTFYGVPEDNVTRTITTYKFSNGKVTEVQYDRYFTNKAIAVYSFSHDNQEIIDRKIKGNLITGKISSDQIGKTKDEILKAYEWQEKIYTKIEK